MFGLLFVLLQAGVQAPQNPAFPPPVVRTTLPGPVDDSDAAPAKRAPFWQDALRDAFCTLSGNIVIDIPRLSLLTHPPRLRPAGSAILREPVPVSDEDAVTLTAAFLWRTPIPMRQGWVLAPSGEASDLRTARTEALNAWIQPLLLHAALTLRLRSGQAARKRRGSAWPAIRFS